LTQAGPQTGGAPAGGPTCESCYLAGVLLATQGGWDGLAKATSSLGSNTGVGLKEKRGMAASSPLLVVFRPSALVSRLAGKQWLRARTSAANETVCQSVLRIDLSCAIPAHFAHGIAIRRSIRLGPTETWLRQPTGDWPWTVASWLVVGFSESRGTQGMPANA
jgi:hypothetical protein